MRHEHGKRRHAVAALRPRRDPGRAGRRARAQGAAGFTDAQRTEIVGILRDALRSDPSILREALEALEAADRRDREGASRAAIAAHADALFRNPADPVDRQSARAR